MSHNAVFVYGTLKPGERYEYIAKRGGRFEAKEASVEGFKLFHLRKENYPAVVPGEGIVRGHILFYENIERALPYLDHLEGVNLDPPEYHRISTTAQPDGEEVYLYVYANEKYLNRWNANLVEDGMWFSDKDAREGSSTEAEQSHDDPV